jgi:hypothetical protein
MYAVTNWHVIKECPVIRVNKLDGDVECFDILQDQWQFDSNGHDIAAVPMRMEREKLDVQLIMDDWLLTDSGIEEHSIGPGENVFMAGRFVDIDGPTNQPAVRFGHISLMPVPLKLKVNKKKRASYCCDVHSRSGFSGSPVFVY